MSTTPTIASDPRANPPVPAVAARQVEQHFK